MTTTLLIVESVVLVLLLVLVLGLLRSHASILRRLHEIDTNARPTTPATPAFRAMPGNPDPVPLDQPFVKGADITGRTLDNQSVLIRTSGVEHRTVLAFLSSSCSTCQTFWEEFAATDLRLPENTRLVILAKDASEESPSALAAVRPRGIDLVMSSQAWADYQVPGSPYVVCVDPDGTVKGEGTGMSWTQVARMLAESTGDAGFVADTSARRRKPESDADREARVDRELIAAGILPGDERLYPAHAGEALAAEQQPRGMHGHHHQ